MNLFESYPRIPNAECALFCMYGVILLLENYPQINIRSARRTLFRLTSVFVPTLPVLVPDPPAEDVCVPKEADFVLPAPAVVCDCTVVVLLACSPARAFPVVEP